MKLSWGTSITIVYAVFALATLGFVAFAMTQRVDLVRTDYYEEALRHDSMQVARARAVQQGRVVRLQDYKLYLEGKGGASEDIQVTIEWLRAQNPAMDERLKTTMTALMEHGVSIRHLERGKWTLRMLWNAGKLSYQIDTTFTL